MGMLVDGVWVNQDRVIENGRFVRPDSAFRDAPSGETDDPSSDLKGRYVLFASLSCPWSHRTTLAHALKGLSGIVDLHIVGEPRTEGYALDGGQEVTVPGIPHPVWFLHQVYSASSPGYTGRTTVPVLWDSREGRIVNNESAEILRILNRCFDGAGASPTDLYPEARRGTIDRWNNAIYHRLNNGVYRAGFAETQSAYEDAVSDVFAMLNELEAHLSRCRYIAGEELCEADLRLFATLVRFDAVYHSHFKCSRRRIADYPVLSAYLEDLLSIPAIAATVDLDAIRHAYYFNDRTINPFGIVPVAYRVCLDPNSPDIGRAR